MVDNEKFIDLERFEQLIRSDTRLDILSDYMALVEKENSQSELRIPGMCNLDLNIVKLIIGMEG